MNAATRLNPIADFVACDTLIALNLYRSEIGGASILTRNTL